MHKNRERQSGSGSGSCSCSTSAKVLGLGGWAANAVLHVDAVNDRPYKVWPDTPLNKRRPRARAAREEPPERAEAEQEQDQEQAAFLWFLATARPRRPYGLGTCLPRRLFANACVPLRTALSFSGTILNTWSSSTCACRPRANGKLSPASATCLKTCPCRPLN